MIEYEEVEGVATQVGVFRDGDEMIGRLYLSRPNAKFKYEVYRYSVPGERASMRNMQKGSTGVSCVEEAIVWLKGFYKN